MHSTRVARTRPRVGFTLLEVILVMAVLLAFLSITWPTIDRLYGDHQLKQSASDVRNLLANTRFHSMDSGVMYQFRYEPQGQSYVAVPYELDNLDEDSASGGDSAGAAGWALAGTLPQHIRFEVVNASDQASEQIPPEFLAALPNANDLSAVAWSIALIFYPDGSATAAAFDIVDEKSQYVRLTVRDLTGVPTATRVGTRDEK